MVSPVVSQQHPGPLRVLHSGLVGIFEQFWIDGDGTELYRITFNDADILDVEVEEFVQAAARFSFRSDNSVFASLA